MSLSPSVTLTNGDVAALRYAAGFIGISFSQLSLVLARLPKKDRVSRDLLECAMHLSEDAQVMLVTVNREGVRQQQKQLEAPVVEQPATPPRRWGRNGSGARKVS